jgi:acyl-coenzyme A synthetase/AMP-(fatty) acid ligase
LNFAADVVDNAPPERLAIVELARDGSRRELSFGEVSARAGALAGRLEATGIGRGDVVLTLIGNRPEWVLTLIACFRIGAVVLPCTEQLRSDDLRKRLSAAEPTLIVADGRNREELTAAAPECPVWWIPDEDLWNGPVAPAAALAATDPALLTFTSGTSGEPKAVVHAQRYLAGQTVQAEHWLGAREGDLVWCTASSGWSKSARNSFIAPWIRGAGALLHDGRFDPVERMEICAREEVDVLCMAPTEYRIIVKRTELPALPRLRACVAAGEALNPEIIDRWRQACGVEIRDGYGQTETGQLTGSPPEEPVRPGSMGRALPGVKLWIDDGELVADPATVPTFFTGYLGDEPPPADEPWRTGDRVELDEDGFFWFQGRTDDVIISSGYRIGPFEVESALLSHAAVAEAAVVAAPDEDRGSIVRAVCVLRDGYVPSGQLTAELQTHVRGTTAPYKYPRVVEYVPELPKTASGKIRRALLREG